MRALPVSDRRFLTAGVFAIAYLLEICGCNPLRNVDRAKATGITSIGWMAVLDRCANCFPDAAAKSVTDSLAQDRRDGKGLVAQDLSASFAGDTPALTELIGKEVPSFYDPDPETLAEYPRDAPSIKSVLSLDDKPGPWTIPESVFFVYKTIVTSDGKGRRIPSATAFVISVPDLTHKTSVRFLVTARHVVDPEWAHCSEKNPRSIDIRFNRRNGGVGYETIPLQNDDLRGFFTPSDGTADLAVIRLDQHLVPNLESYKFFDTPFRLLPTDSELHMIHPDQQIMTAGLLTQTSPDMSSYPVSHGGVLSGNSTEAVSMKCGTAPGSTQLHVWFLHAAIAQGVGGAPVFTSMSREEGGAKTPVLLGVQAVAWPDRGIAGMTPSTVLNDLIHQALPDGKRMDFSKGTKP